MDLNTLIRAFALHNALKYNGKANPGAVIGKVLSEHAELKSDMKKLAQAVQTIVKEVNALKPEKQLAELQKIAPEMLEEKKKEEKKELPELPDVKGPVKTCFPPEPSGYPHLGHGKGALINMLYAKKYGGRFALRFEDTNPELATQEFVDRQLEGLRWLGITWDELVFISDEMPALYKHCEDLVQRGHFYACTCDKEKISQRRMDGKNCPCRDKKPAEHLALWNEMRDGKHEKGDVIIRWKGDMQHQNTVMRDPTMLRICTTPHFKHGTTYKAWPSYDFAAAVLDGKMGITHRVRSKEYELRAELQKTLQHLLSYPPTIIVEQARFNLVGVEASKRKIREGIREGTLSGWDDIRLSTLATLRRRGYQPEALRDFLLSLGITKHESTITWDTLDSFNRKIIDTASNRAFFVRDPVRITIENAPSRLCEVPVHPEHPERGRRALQMNGTILISKNDADLLKQGKLYRLMENCNFTKKKSGYEFDSPDVDTYRKKGERIMHWLPADAGNVKVEVLLLDATTATGMGEETLKKLEVGQIIQFERFGFCRLDAVENGTYKFWWTHK